MIENERIGARSARASQGFSRISTTGLDQPFKRTKAQELLLLCRQEDYSDLAFLVDPRRTVVTRQDPVMSDRDDTSSTSNLDSKPVTVAEIAEGGGYARETGLQSCLAKDGCVFRAQFESHKSCQIFDSGIEAAGGDGVLAGLARCRCYL